MLKNLHQVPPSINGVYCQDTHRNEQAGITDVKEAPQKPRKKNTISSVPNLRLPEVTQAQVPHFSMGFSYSLQPVPLGAPLSSSAPTHRLPSFSPYFLHPHSWSTMVSFIFYTCHSLLDLFYTPLFRFLREGNQVGPGSLGLGRDFVLSPSNSLLTRLWPVAAIQPAVVSGAECSPCWIPGQKEFSHKGLRRVSTVSSQHLLKKRENLLTQSSGKCCCLFQIALPFLTLHFFPSSTTISSFLSVT